MLVLEVTAIASLSTVVVVQLGKYIYNGIVYLYRRIKFRNRVTVTRTNNPKRFYQLTLKLSKYITENLDNTDSRLTTMEFSLPDALNEQTPLCISVYAPGTWFKIPEFPDIEIEVLGNGDDVSGYTIWSKRFGTEYNTVYCADRFLAMCGDSMSDRFKHIKIPVSAMMRSAFVEYEDKKRLHNESYVNHGRKYTRVIQ